MKDESAKRVTARLAELVEVGEKVLATRQDPGPNVISDDYVDSQLLSQWSTSVLNLLARAFGTESEHYKSFARNFESGEGDFTPAAQAFGALKAAQDDFDHGHIYELRSLVEADVFDDIMEQAEQLLSAGYHPAAAVVAGCVLEDALRKMCYRRNIALPSKPKLDQMNAELAKAGEYNKLVQKRLTALADLRNKAAHGNWNEFSAADVQDMVAGVKRFMGDNFA